ncbi:putative porin [Colwellia piezophila]|uniref:putative porin n=1 Tax=Colwellia piezophila TaxID=211668 RepID=UPI000366C407|nr:putative porin [Colwellia piezophila]
MKLSKLSKLSALATLLLSNTVLAQSYQSFSNLNYSQRNFTSNNSTFNRTYKSDSDNITLSSQYYFDERLTLGPLNEFDYINTLSNVYLSAGHGGSDSFSADKSQDYNQESSWNSEHYSVSIGGEWITNSFIFGGSYSYRKASHDGDFQLNSDSGSYSYENSSSYFSLKFGYLFTDNFVISAEAFDDDDGGNLVTFNASYNWQLSGTDYIGFSYDVNEDFDYHQLSTRYFFGISTQSYLVLGVDYTLWDFEYFGTEDTWSVNSSYYYNDSASISASYGEEGNYSVSTNYFVNENYSLSAGYNSITDNKVIDKADGYFVGFSAQF